MATHTIEKIGNWNPLARAQWVRIDGERTACLIAASEADVDAQIARLREQLATEDDAATAGEA